MDLSESCHRTIIDEALKFMESEEMRSHLLSPTGTPGLWQCFDLIAQSRAPLADKACALKKIADMYPQLADEHCNPSKMAAQARAALEETNGAPPGSIFILTEYWLDPDIEWNYDEFFGDLAKKGSTPFSTYDKAVAHIAEENSKLYEADETVSDDVCQWNEITRWDLDQNSNLDEAITWFLSNSGVIWGYDREWERRNHRFLFGDDNFLPGSTGGLNLPTPFAHGDIITVDMRPFVDVFHAVITMTRDGRDCCDPTCLYFNKRGVVDFGALKHRSFRVPNFSPLLRASLYDGDLPELEAPLKVISERVRADESLGDMLFEVGGYRKREEWTWANLEAVWLGGSQSIT